MRIVIDTNVLVRALTRPLGPGREVLNRATVPPHVLCLSRFLLDECTRALHYERLQRISQVPLDEALRVLAHLAAIADVSELNASEATVASDPDDNIVIATAIHLCADVLCTLDRHLRSPAVVAYCSERAIAVLTDVEVLGVLRAIDSAT